MLVRVVCIFVGGVDCTGSHNNTFATYCDLWRGEVVICAVCGWIWKP